MQNLGQGMQASKSFKEFVQKIREIIEIGSSQYYACM
jgi:hypothetical protein